MKLNFNKTKNKIEVFKSESEIRHKFIGIAFVFLCVGFWIGSYTSRVKYSASVSELSNKYKKETKKVCREDFYLNRSINAAKQNYTLQKENIALKEKLEAIKKERERLQKENNILVSLKNLKEESPVIKREYSSNLKAEDVINSIESKKTKSYVSRYYKWAIADHNKYGVPASVKLAQGILESNYGKSSLARNQHNHFGLKYYRPNYPKRIPNWSDYVVPENIVTLHDDDPDDQFVAFKNSWYSYRYHTHFLVGEGSPYLKVLPDDPDYKDWCNALERIGYATGSNYSKKLIKIIEDNNLHLLDKI